MSHRSNAGIASEPPVRGTSVPLEGAQTSAQRGPTAAPPPVGKPATPSHCPFCGDEDLRPVVDDAAAWSCRSCARVFTVRLLRVDQSLIPAHRPVRAHPEAGQS